MKKAFLLCIFAITLCFSACSPTTVSREFFAMDTVMQITLYNANQDLMEKAIKEVHGLETIFSVTVEGSQVHEINQSNGAAVVAPDVISIIQTAKELSEETNGLFDITVYPAVKAWGFTRDENRVPNTEELTALLPLIDSNAIRIRDNTVTLKKGVEIDLGGIAKGYAADTVATNLEQNGCTGGILSFGGNVKTIGTKPDGSLFQIAVQDPNNATNTLGTLSVGGNTAVVTSGDSQRYFEKDGVKYHHILDPRTAAPAKSDLGSVTVVCASATRADALATALYIMGLEDGLSFVNQKEDIEALFVTKQGEIKLSNGLQERFTPNK